MRKAIFKRFFSLIVIIAMIFACLPTISVSAATSGEVTWSLDGTVLTISGNGKMGDYSYYDPAPWGLSITEVIIKNGVTNIGVRAFADCSSLTSVTIGNSVTSIGSSAFTGCSSLTSINVSSDNAYFSSDDGVLFNKDQTKIITVLTGKTGSYIIPESVTSIGGSAFTGCRSLTSITIPDSVTSIGDYAFYYCRSLTSITIPSSVTSIGMGAFEGCSSLISVIIGDGVTCIGEDTFSYCSSLTSVTIGNSVTSIGYLSFHGCSSLISITIPDSVISIDFYAFEYCSSLTSITIPSSVTSIGMCAFYGCSSLTSINVSSNNACYSSKDGVLFNKDQTEILAFPCGKTGRYTIPNSVINIGSYAFSNCSSLTSIDIPAGVTSIGRGAFSGCTDLTISCYPGSYAWNYAISNSIPVVPAGEVTGISVNKLPTKTVYPIIGNFIADGLTLTVSFADGSYVEMTDGFTVDVDLSTAGERIATVSFMSFTATFKVTVDPDLIEYPESEHDYANYTDQSWTIYKKGVSAISVTFSNNTQTESNYDYIYIYDANGTQIGKYSGTALANKTITVDGDTVRIRLTSDVSGTYYGFAVTDITFVQPVITDIPGDVNSDGKVTAKDRMILSRFLDGWDGYDALCNMEKADIDGDGSVTADDRMILARYLAGWKGYEAYFQ